MLRQTLIDALTDMTDQFDRMPADTPHVRLRLGTQYGFGIEFGKTYLDGVSIAIVDGRTLHKCSTTEAVDRFMSHYGLV